MRTKPELPEVFDVDVTTRGNMPGAADYVRAKIGSLGRLTHEPVLHARVKLVKHADPAVERPVRAQANIDVNGRLVRAEVVGVDVRDAVDRLESRLRHRLERIARHWEARRGGATTNGTHEWRHDSEPTHRPDYFPRPEEDREVMRRKTFGLSTSTVDEAVTDMDLLDYDFHLFTEQGTNQDSVLYRAEPTGYRLAQVDPTPVERLAPFESPVSISPHPAPRLTVQEATERLALLGLPFLFFVDADENRGAILYHRYDGHYGVISPA